MNTANILAHYKFKNLRRIEQAGDYNTYLFMKENFASMNAPLQISVYLSITCANTHSRSFKFQFWITSAGIKANKIDTLWVSEIVAIISQLNASWLGVHDANIRFAQN